MPGFIGQGYRFVGFHNIYPCIRCFGSGDVIIVGCFGGNRSCRSGSGFGSNNSGILYQLHAGEYDVVCCVTGGKGNGVITFFQQNTAGTVAYPIGPGS